MKKKYFNFILISALFISLFFSPDCFAVPTFEVTSGENPYPYVRLVTAIKQSNYMVITAVATDDSGVLSLVANIEVPGSNPAQYMHNVYPALNINTTMRDDGLHYDGLANDNTFGLLIDVSNTAIWDEDATYYIDIVAIDNLLNSSGDNYNHIGSFNMSGAQGTVITAASFFGDATVGSSITLYATLKDQSGNNLAGETLNFFNSTGALIASANTNSSGPNVGIAFVDYNIPLINPATYVRVTYDGNPDADPPLLEATSVDIPLTIGSCGITATNAAGNATICINTSPSTISTTTNNQSISSFLINGSINPSVSVGGTATILAQLSQAISGETINFLDTATGLQIISPLTTNSSGLASSTFQPAFTGTHIIEAVYKGNALKNLEPSVKAATVTSTGNCAVNTAGNATVCIDTSPDTIYWDTNPQSMTFTGGKNGNQITLQAALSTSAYPGVVYFIDFTLGSAIGSASINSSGMASYTYTGSWSGKHTIEAVYKGSPLKGLRPSVRQIRL